MYLFKQNAFTIILRTIKEGMAMPNILICDDEKDIVNALKIYLTDPDNVLFKACNGREALEVVENNDIHLVLLDIMMPGEDGFSLGEDLIRSGIPVIYLTAKTAVPDRVRGLRMGAHDYILKPFEPAELLARVENVLKRTQSDSSIYERGDLRVNFETREVWRAGAPVSLTTWEFNLLKALIDAGRTALSREELLSAVWGYHYTGETRTVDVHVQRLRGKIGADRIETIIRYGYRFREDV